MSHPSIGVALERIDHGVLPSNDLGRAFRFWSTFMGARINFHANLNARGLNREVPMIVFFTVANHPGFGLACRISVCLRNRRVSWTAWYGASRSLPMIFRLSSTKPRGSS